VHKQLLPTRLQRQAFYYFSGYILSAEFKPPDLNAAGAQAHHCNKNRGGSPGQSSQGE
jgi:hypothetical protein